MGSCAWGGGGGREGLSQFCTCYSVDMSICVCVCGEGGGCLWIHLHIMDEFFSFLFFILFSSVCVCWGQMGGGMVALDLFSLFRAVILVLNQVHVLHSIALAMTDVQLIGC